MDNMTEKVQLKVRDSNLELFRIITMFLIVAHHYVVNSGLSYTDGPLAKDPLSLKSLYLMVFGAWGKTGINCFLMITGYFMCKSHITVRKFLKLVFEVEFYSIVIYLVFLLLGYESLSVQNIIRVVFPVTSIQQNFTGCFIVFYLFIPFLNILVQNMNEKQHIRLILLLSFTYILFGTIHGRTFSVAMNYVSWYMVLYFIASYIRLYPKKWFSDNRICGSLLIVSIVISVVSIVGCAWLGTRIGTFMPYFFVTDSNTFLAVVVGVFAFLIFKNLRIPQSRFINAVAATTFGVMQIHANSDAMRRWLWVDTLKNVEHYDSKFAFLYPVIVVLAVFTICSVIDFARIKLLEEPLFKYIKREG